MMEVLLHIIFGLSIWGILHSYLFYPLWVVISARRRPFPDPPDWFPHVSVLIPVFNEEKVVQAKLDSLSGLNYPPEKLHVFIGSDASTDATHDRIRRHPLAGKIHFFPFAERRGKPSVINELAEKAIAAYGAGPDHIFMLTDANVLHHPDALRWMARHFQDPAIGLVDSRMVPTGQKQAGISRSERQYLIGESQLKYLEGKAWGCMMGPFGGCYTIRADRYHPAPPHHLVDDFYIAMKVLERGGRLISEPRAWSYEGLSHQLREEFRRKVRIAAGNFQNLAAFAGLWFPPIGAVRFAFFSHKTLRWMGPFLVLAAWISSALLTWWVVFGLLSLLLIGAPLLDLILSRVGLNLLPLRSVAYFILMNAALFLGFFRYLGGVKTGIWQPTKRQDP